MLVVREVDGDGSRDESILISAFRASPSVRLTNVTEGGEGSPGVHRTEKEKAHLSRINLGRKITWGHKISETKRGGKFSDEHRMALSLAQRGKARPWLCGQKNPRAVLTDEKVRAIRDDNRKQRIVAAEYGVSGSLISGVRSGKCWGHVL